MAASLVGLYLRITAIFLAPSCSRGADILSTEIPKGEQPKGDFDGLDGRGNGVRQGGNSFLSPPQLSLLSRQPSSRRSTKPAQFSPSQPAKILPQTHLFFDLPKVTFLNLQAKITLPR